MSNQTERIVSLAISGDARAFEELCRMFYDQVYRLAYYFLRNKQDSEDVVQTVFIKLGKALPELRKISSFSAWLKKMTVNEAKDFIKANSRKRERESAYIEHTMLHSDNPGLDCNTDGQEKLLSAIHELPEKYRDAVILVYGEGLSHREAARVLGCAETTVSWRILRAKEKLKRYLS